VAPTDVYLAAFAARCDVRRRPGQPEIDEPGVHGLLASREDPLIRLLVTDDRAYDVLQSLLPAARAGTITVFAAAARCTELLTGGLGWPSKRVTAMACRDLQAVPAARLPSTLTLRPVRRSDGDGPDGVALKDAVALAMRADPTIANPPSAFADFLRSLPPAFRLLAAVDHDGVVRATSGCGAFGAQATVMFVNTARGWRRRGIGEAMSAAALCAARDAGATQAGLDSSPAGLPIYRRLGFQAVADARQFSRR
jgi:GNAT superfamily N-acetyltransferase